MSMVSLKPLLTDLLDSLPSDSVEQTELDAAVKEAIIASKKNSTFEATRKSQWEFTLKNEVFILAATEGSAAGKDGKKAYYSALCRLLDVILTFTEQGKSLSPIGVFPLGERSGVNLRGEYGPVWEGVGDHGRKRSTSEEEQEADRDAMLVDAPTGGKAAEAKKKEDIYDTFWSLQLPFSKPPLFAQPETFPQFKESVNKVLPIIKEATAKERALMGSRSSSGASTTLKRKREPEAEEVNSTNQDYFFAKFLTSPDLLDLEIADTHFRRQFLFQLLVLLHHLMTFTPAAKAIWTAQNNRALQMEFTLETADAQWVQDTINRVMEELRQTTPNGRAFSDAVSVIMEREKNWVGWKNHLCAPFDKAPVTFSLGDDGKFGTLFEATSGDRAKMREPPEDHPWSHGSEALSEIWEMGCRGLTDLEQPFQPGDVKDFVKKIKMEDQRIELRKKQLARLRPPPPPLKKEETPAPMPPVKVEVTPAPMKVDEPSPSKPSTPAPAPPPSDTLAAPQPQLANAGASPLHPSLPPKPGSAPLKPPTPVPTPTPTPTATTAPAPAGGEGSEQQAAPTPAPAPAPAPSPTPAPEEPKPKPKPKAVVLPPDPMIAKYEEASIIHLLLPHNKQRWAWIALRTARDQYLQHFGKIGTGDIELLAKEIEEEKTKQEKERLQKEKGEEVKGGDGKGEEGVGEEGLSVVMNGVNGSCVADNGDDGAAATTVVEKAEGEDVKMEES
ncbi:hypothetical protein H0H92_003566 [Tricholoma furcatifolium]|nr:hypothetical protein H0H92_003566 [Tricholoma furcatifolium]